MNEKFQKQQGESQADFFFFLQGVGGGEGGGLNNFPTFMLYSTICFSKEMVSTSLSAFDQSLSNVLCM